MKIFIDTTKPDKSLVRSETEEFEDYDNKELLALVDTAIGDKDPLDIQEVSVNPGPGSRFTKTRIGVVVANAIAFATKSNVNNKEFETPKYHKEPNITKPTK